MLNNPAHQALPVGSILLLILGLSFAALNGALMKLLASDVSPFFIVWARYLGSFIVMLPIAMIWARSENIWKPARPTLQFMRALTMTVATVSFVIGAKTTDFANSIAILYVYPFLITLMAPWFLNEKVPLVAWFGVIGGFTGVLLVAKPSFSGLDIGASYILLCGFMAAAHMVFNRKIGPLTSPLITSMWGGLIAAILLSFTVPFFWSPLSAEQWAIILAIAALSAISQSLTLVAFARAQASLLAPFTYAEVVSAIFIGLAIFGTLPDILSWAGISLIVLSGLLVAKAPQLGALVSRRRQPPV